MRHKVAGFKLKRDVGARKALLRNLVTSVIERERVVTTVPKAKAAKPLVERLKLEAVKEPQPEVHIRGDLATRYESIGRVVVACQRAGIAKVGFITEPPGGAQ